MARIRWTHEAALWLQEIYNYVARDNPEAAADTIAGIYETVQSLVEFPQLGHRYSLSRGRKIRILLYEHYRIA